MLKNIYSFKNSRLKSYLYLNNSYNKLYSFKLKHFSDSIKQEHSNNPHKNPFEHKLTINITNDKKVMAPSKTIEITEKINIDNKLHYEKTFNNYI